MFALSQGSAPGNTEVHVKEHAFTPFLASLLPDCDVEGKVGGIFLWTDLPALPIRKIPPPSLPALSSIPPPPLSLSALYARTGAEKSAGQGTPRRKKQNKQQKNRSSFFFFYAFPLHHYERTGAPAHKNLRCMHTHTHTLWHSLSRRINSQQLLPWHLIYTCVRRREVCSKITWSRWRRTCHGYRLTPSWGTWPAWCQTRSAVRPSAWTAAAAVWIWPMAASLSRAKRAWAVLHQSTTSNSSGTSFTFRT